MLIFVVSLTEIYFSLYSNLVLIVHCVITLQMSELLGLPVDIVVIDSLWRKEIVFLGGWWWKIGKAEWRSSWKIQSLVRAFLPYEIQLGFPITCTEKLKTNRYKIQANNSRFILFLSLNSKLRWSFLEYFLLTWTFLFIWVEWCTNFVYQIR